MFLPEVLEAIIDALQDKYIKPIRNESEWIAIANDFQKLWHFPHTLGAIDGKHIPIKAPPHSGSDFYNYKGFFSIVLLGIVDAHSRFIFIDVGGNGRAIDVMVYKNSAFHNALSKGELNIPRDEPLKGQIQKTPYFIGDDILNRNLLKAYNRNSNLSISEEAFNYRLSRARMTVEMAFGRLSTRFRIFHRPIELKVETCDLIVQSCCILHNFLSQELVGPQNPHNVQQEDLPSTMTRLPTQEREYYKYACEMRDNVRKYCVTDGDVPFQCSKIKKQVAI